MSAPAKFLFDVDFASGTNRKPGGATITLAEHAIKLAEVEASARRQGYADAQTDAKVADAAFGVAIAAGVAGLVLILTNPRQVSGAVTPPSHRAFVTPYAGPNGGGLTGGLSF